jgi:hypothetical protein
MGVPVADLEFNLNDVTSLAEKLKALQPNLSQQEYMLLLAIFAAAAARATVTSQAAQTSTLPVPEISGQKATTPISRVTPETLKNQLLNAYIPGNYFQAVDPSTQDKITGDRTTG